MHKKILIAIAALFVVAVIYGVVQTARVYPVLFQIIFSREIDLKKSNENINVLLLGTGGGSHQGPDLTDTIIFASINSGDDKIVLISIPRDLWIPDLYAKVNTAYAFGNSKKSGGGIILAQAVVGKVIGQPINYVFRIDFDGFVKAVDLVGGLEVDVERSFDDFEYPVSGREDDLCGQKEEDMPDLATFSSQLDAFPCRYTHLHFDKGVQHMDGETALRFVRSRHAEGVEGTDFARNKRQEKVLIAFKNKVLALETLINPVKILGLYSTIEDSIDTNIQDEEIDDFIRLAHEMEDAEIKSITIDYGNEENDVPGLLINPLISSEYNNQWVLIPRVGNGDFSEIHKFVECEINNGNCSISREVPQKNQL